jgi:hypothetical protein
MYLSIAHYLEFFNVLFKEIQTGKESARSHEALQNGRLKPSEEPKRAFLPIDSPGCF